MKTHRLVVRAVFSYSEIIWFMVMPAWRNGRRSRLKIYRTQVCMSSSLIAGKERNNTEGYLEHIQKLLRDNDVLKLLVINIQGIITRCLKVLQVNIRILGLIFSGGDGGGDKR